MQHPPPSNAQQPPTKKQVVSTWCFVIFLFALCVTNVYGILFQQEITQAIIGAVTTTIALIFAMLQVFIWMWDVIKKKINWVLVGVIILSGALGAVYYRQTIHRINTANMTPKELYNYAFNTRIPDFASNLMNDRENWDTAQYDSGDGCAFADHYVFTIKTKGSVIPCFARDQQVVDFAASVHMHVVTGTAAGGFILRSAGNTIDYSMYRYNINPPAQTFDFLVQRNNSQRFNPNCDDFGSQYCKAVEAINKTEVNTLEVIAIGPKFYFYANGLYLITISDHAFSRGMIGLFAVNNTPQESSVTVPVVVRFDSFALWNIDS